MKINLKFDDFEPKSFDAVKLSKEMRSYNRRRRWRWIRHPILSWQRRKEHKNFSGTTASTAGAGKSVLSMDKMLKLLKDLKPVEPKAVLVSATMAEELKNNAPESTAPFPPFCPWGGMNVFAVDDAVFDRFDLDVHKVIVGPEADIMHLYDVMSWKLLGGTLLEWAKKEIVKMEQEE